MVGHFLDEGVGHVGDRNAELGRDIDIDRIDTDAAQRHDFQLLARLDHLGGDARAALAVDRVGVDRRFGKIVLAARNLDDFRADPGQSLHFQGMVRISWAGRHDLETRHVLSPPSI